MIPYTQQATSDEETETLINEKDTVKKKLDWAYANLAAYRVALENDPPRYDRNAWAVRSRLYKGLQNGSMRKQSIYKNEREKLSGISKCSYCGSGAELTLDHLFPKSRGGSDSGDNLVYCCQKCNSSKHNKDYFEWIAEKSMPTSPEIAERYLKNAYAYCEAHDLLDAANLPEDNYLPFSLESIPDKFQIISPIV